MSKIVNLPVKDVKYYTEFDDIQNEHTVIAISIELDGEEIIFDMDNADSNLITKLCIAWLGFKSPETLKYNLEETD